MNLTMCWIQAGLISAGFARVVIGIDVCSNMLSSGRADQHRLSIRERQLTSTNWRGNRSAVWLQGELPALTCDGQIILASPTLPAMSPNGNGGIYEALAK